MKVKNDDTLVTLAYKPDQKRDSLAVRKTVFVEEQHVPTELVMDDFDSDDNTAHFVSYYRSKPVGSARMRKLDRSNIGKVERVAVLKEARGLGIGQSILHEVETYARKEAYSKLTLNAQVHAQSFYERLGYQTIGDIFLAAGIQHITMEKELD